ncbi:alpha/beta hydrolase [Bdellovibrio sp. SKB1291214]|uniref:alpha/beta fold hydrolase n=1 Tax=Bdellovibrio sp. SKB1291214 TaxID=1732569 RepID=UPI000B51E279|nr:alpha/beta hydrolase [Bdellovibrio sp. SKB1291214]UYL09246.1 alpha/beta hydrolase [Bdellovibrio sp. SKB1291214]
MNKNQSLPIVFLHGFLCDPRLWTSVQTYLRYEGPSYLIDFKFCKTLEEMLEQIEIIEAPRFHMVGFSMGGYIAEVFATKYPERIETLTLIAANVGSLSELEQSSRLKMADMLSRVQYKGMSEKEVMRFIHPRSGENPEVIKVIQEMSQAYTSEMYVNQMRATLQRKDLTAALEGLTFPITIIAGREDRVVSLVSLQNFHDRIKRSQFTVIEETGHYIPLEKPLEIAHAIKQAVSL